MKAALSARKRLAKSRKWTDTRHAPRQCLRDVSSSLLPPIKTVMIDHQNRSSSKTTFQVFSSHFVSQLRLLNAVIQVWATTLDLALMIQWGAWWALCRARYAGRIFEIERLEAAEVLTNLASDVVCLIAKGCDDGPTWSPPARPTPPRIETRQCNNSWPIKSANLVLLFIQPIQTNAPPRVGNLEFLICWISIELLLKNLHQDQTAWLSRYAVQRALYTLLRWSEQASMQEAAVTHRQRGRE
jgi:hypothetical protein